jgi:DNA topoisomerase-1
MKSLLIVESPTKVKTLSKFLGKEFVIKASVGHVKDLPKRELGVDIEDNFRPTYVVIDGKDKILRELKRAARDADRVFLAPDPDREGEAIAWHIAEELDGDSDKILRVEFNEITERAVKEALKNPRRLNPDLFNAQQARRILDRLVGYKLSPLLWRKVRRGLSAGRVQSVALRLVVDREREIEAFRPVEYWSITATLEGGEPPRFDAKLHQLDGKKAEIGNEAEAKRIVDEVDGRPFIVKRVEKKRKTRSPSPPFITSTLQQEAARKLRFTAKRTMLIAQQLYEGVELGDEGSVGLITYMRTDSVRVAVEAQDEAREYIREAYGEQYIPPKPPVYKSKKTAQEAHEAIRPTSVFRTPDRVKGFLSRDQYRLYTLIWNRFIASQMRPAQLEQTTVDIEAGRCLFRATGTVVRFPGFMSLYTEGVDDATEEGEKKLPSLKEGDSLRVLSIVPRQHFTQPPPRYTEATLVKELEARGIGRPSTYATILSTIQERKYVEKVDGRFRPTELGVLVNDLLVQRFSDIMDYNFTARMEDNLDKVEAGKFRWVDVVMDFYRPFDKDLTEAMESLGRIKPADIPTDEVCERCGRPMVIKWGKHGRFIACSGFPKCRNRRPLRNEEAEVEAQETDEVCEKCGSRMVLKKGRFGRFLSCSRYPECKNTKPYGLGIKCPEDDGEIVERRTKKGRVFYSCSNYPACKFATWYRPVPRNCPRCIDGVLAEKRTKKEEVYVCLKKGCGYKEQIPAHVEEAGARG